MFLDQDGIPTIVEVKRSANTQIRREVVGQMLDYAANAVVYWSVDHVREHYESQNTDSEEQLIDFLDGRCEPEDFWMNVKTNLEAGRVRMVFVADVIPPELQRIVEFLNTQMNPAEVLAVQIKQYSGPGLKTLVPRVIGLTAIATEKKSGGRQKRKWDEPSFMEAIEAGCGTASAETSRELLSWANNHKLRIWWGEGLMTGSFQPMCDVDGESHYTFGVRTNGYIEVLFHRMRSNSPFGAETKRLSLLERLNSIDGIELSPDVIRGNPKFRIDVLNTKASFDAFLGAFDWVLSEIRQSR